MQSTMQQLLLEYEGTFEGIRVARERLKDRLCKLRGADYLAALTQIRQLDEMEEDNLFALRSINSCVRRERWGGRRRERLG